MPKPVMWRDRLGLASAANADKRLQMRVTQGELIIIRSRAAKSGLRPSDYLLSLVAADIAGDRFETPCNLTPIEVK